MKRTIKLTFAFATLFVTFLLVGLASHAQDKRLVTGVVRDTSGLGVPGVSVKVKGSTANKGAITDESGAFEIRAAVGETLIFTSIGYVPKEASVGATGGVSVLLLKNSSALGEVVVTGFGGRQSTRKLAYSITEVKGSELVAANNSNIGDALQGKVAGVTISQGTGGPSSSSRIQIRGNARLSGNTEPLVVLDGILIQPSTTGADSWGGGQDFGNIIKDLNPDDYESITVLKGSAASALYGSQALNGVLLITTKKGHARKGLGVSYNQTVSYDKAYKLPDLQNSYGGGLKSTFDKDASGNDIVDQSASYWTTPNAGYSYGPAFDGHLVKDLDGRMVPWKANNPLKDFFVTGKFINTNVATEGGNDNASFRASYTNLFNSSVTPNNSLNKNSFSLRGTQKVSNFISMDASVNYTTTKVLNPIIQGGGGTSNPLGGILYASPRNADVKYYSQNYIDLVNGGIKNTPTTDPYYLAHLFWPMFKNNVSQTENVLLADLDITGKITPWLTALVRANVTNYNDMTTNEQYGQGAGFSGGSFEQDQSSYKNTRVQGVLSATRDIGKDFALNASIGGEIQNQLGGPITKAYTNGGLQTPGLWFIANSVSAPTTSVTLNPKSIIDAVYAYGDLTWRNMLTFDFSVRNDWSSTLTYADGHGKYTYAYPSVGLAWVFTELDQFRSSVLSYGKLRGSIGWTGYSADPYVTNSTGNYGSVGTFNNASNSNQTLYTFSDGQGNYNTTLGNQNLRNELAREIEFGADLRFLHNRIGIDVAYYKKNSFNQILSLPADQEAGISGRTINAGNIQNQGVEALLTASPIKSKDFSWDMTVNFTANKNKIISLYPGVVSDQLSLAFGADVAAYAIAGKDYGTVKTGYAFSSYDGKNSSLQGQRVLGTVSGATAGALAYVRSQNYGAGTQKTLGNIMPRFLWGTFQTFTYKGFILGIQVDSKVGGLLASATDQYGSETGNLKSSLPGRNAKLGGVNYTDNNGVSHDDGIIPKGVIADGTIVGGVDVGGQTYADAVKAGSVKPIPAYAYYENLTQWSTGIREQSIFDNSWVALRQVSLGYNLPASIYRAAKLNGLKVSVTGRNLFYIWKNARDGVNPEGLYNNQAANFAEGGGLPYIRSYGATLNASF